MSEAHSRPARGRSSARGGRGSYASRGSRKTNGDGASHIDTSADQGELGELKKRYSSQLSTLKELFPDWTDADLVLAIEESDGDLQTTIEKISEGSVSQFAEVPKKAKDRSRSKAKENTNPSDAVRGNRGEGTRRGDSSVRGGRARGADRGRGGLRGGRGASTNGSRAAQGSVPTTEWSAYDSHYGDHATDDSKENEQDSWSHVPEILEKPVAVVKETAKKTWASMFAAPKPPPAVPKSAAKSSPVPKESPLVSHDAPTHDKAQEPSAEELPISPVMGDVPEEPPLAVENISTLTPDKMDEDLLSEVIIEPSKDKLTEENVEHLPDVSNPPPTLTAHSTVASSKDVGSAIATPLNGPVQAIGRPGMGGFATTALKATSGTSHRSTSFQRRLQEQQEPVVMPGNHAVDRTAVQFGNFGLGDASDLDVDEDREEAETRTQPPQHSPVAAPRAALPPAPRQESPAETPQQDSLPATKPAPGLPFVPQQQQQPLPQHSPSNPLASQAMQNQGSQSNQPYNQFGRYGQAGAQSETSAPPQKPYDPFGQQLPQSSQYEYNNQQSQAQSQSGTFSSAPDNFSSQHLTTEQRAQYQNYYGSYGQQNSSQSQQEAGSAQPRTGSGFGSGPNDSSYLRGQEQSQGRYQEATNSGHNTPNPASHQGHASQGQHMPQHGQQGHGGGYQYNHPYYGSPYYANYMNQFGGYGQGGGYGSFGKGMYGQHPHYGMSPQASYEQHSSSPANTGGFGSSSVHERGSGMGGGFSDYGRSGAGASQNQSATVSAGGFGSLPDSFGRNHGYSGQGSYTGQPVGQQGLGEESLKPFGDSKSGGPSPSALGAQPGRPGSATQNAPGQSGQGGLPQHSQQGFGNFPNQLGGGNQYGGLGGLGHQNSSGHQQQQQQQQGGYGNYGGFGGYGGGGSFNSRGGWGGNYGQH